MPAQPEQGAVLPVPMAAGSFDPHSVAILYTLPDTDRSASVTVYPPGTLQRGTPPRHLLLRIIRR